METDTKPQPETLLAAMARHGLTVAAEFVPLSKSRNANETTTLFGSSKPRKVYSLNWRVTLQHNGRDVLTTDYSAGMAHCPAYGTKPPSNYPDSLARWQADAPAWECERGVAAGWLMNGFHPAHRSLPRVGRGTPIMPNAADVVHSLISDAAVLDYPTFESWAGDSGYDPDSRKGEAIYRACLELALKLRCGLGDAAMRDLAEACEGY